MPQSFWRRLLGSRSPSPQLSLEGLLRRSLARQDGGDLRELASTVAAEVRVQLDLPLASRRFDWGTLAAAAAAVHPVDPEAWRQLVGAHHRHQFAHYQLQKDSGMSREDLGEPMSYETCRSRLCDYARSALDAFEGAGVGATRHRLDVLEREPA